MADSKIFISYDRDDKWFVDKLCAQLRRVQQPFWADTRELRGGQKWMDRIEEALRAASVVLVVISPSSLASEYVSYEWAFARGARKSVIPLIIADVELPSTLKVLQWIDFTPDRKPWARLVSDIDAAHTESALAAPHPKIRAELGPLEKEHKPGDDYRINLWIDGAPDARRVKYELDPDLFKEPVWSEKNASDKFRTWMESSGDAIVGATIVHRDSKRQKVYVTLRDALWESHANGRGKLVRAALAQIADG